MAKIIFWKQPWKGELKSSKKEGFQIEQLESLFSLESISFYDFKSKSLWLRR